MVTERSYERIFKSLILKRIKSLIFGECGRRLRNIKSFAWAEFFCPQSCPQVLSSEETTMAKRYFGIFNTVFSDRHGP
jgi:hypothetical protein